MRADNLAYKDDLLVYGARTFIEGLRFEMATCVNTCSYLLAQRAQ